MRNFFGTMSIVAVSAAAAEAAMNTAAKLDTRMLVDMANMPKPNALREDNSDEMTGYEEATEEINLGRRAGMSMRFSRMQAQHAAFILAYGMGDVASSDNGSGTYLHLIKPTGDIMPPSFTMGARIGANIVGQRFRGNIVDSFKLTIERDKFAVLEAEILGSGALDTDYVDETLTASGTATTLTLANAVLDDDAENVQSVACELASGTWTETTCTGASGTAITVTAIAGASGTAKSWRVQYRTEQAWSALPAAVTEERLKMTDLTISIGGKFSLSGTAVTYSGGKSFGGGVTGFTWSYENASQMYGTPAGTGAYANEAIRGKRKQTLTLNRQLRDYIVQHLRDEVEYFTVRATLASENTFVGAHKYTVDLIWPRVVVRSAELGDDDGKLTEAAEIAVKEDATYGSVVAIIKNAVEEYAS
ncbi:MAG TPA: hypothetical protein PK745_00465 [bacterium]|nr:hypothetical protein [bacterium]